jgi:hypothetical protein
MRINKVLAVSVGGCALVGASILPATAGPSHAASTKHPVVASTHVFHTTLSTHSPSKGTTMTLIGTGAKKKTSYTCVLTVIHGTAYTVDEGSFKTVKSSKKGRVVCHEKYEPYKTISLTGGAAGKCPVTKKQKKAGYKCGFAVSTTDKSSSGIQYFVPKK